MKSWSRCQRSAALGGSLRLPLAAGAVAICLAATGANAQEARIAEPPLQLVPDATPPKPRVLVSEPKKITGIVLTSIGTFHGVLGSIVAFGFGLGTMGGGGDGLGGVLALMGGGAVMLEGSILVAVGVPLWVSGGRPARNGGAARPADPFAPELRLGGGVARASWSF